MKKVREFLEKGGYEFDSTRFGSNGFSVPGLLIAFYWDGIGNSKEQKAEFEKYIKTRSRSAVSFRRISGGSAIVYHITTKADAEALADYDKKFFAENEKYWQEEHARRMAAAV